MVGMSARPLEANYSSGERLMGNASCSHQFQTSNGLALGPFFEGTDHLLKVNPRISHGPVALTHWDQMNRPEPFRHSQSQGTAITTT